MSVDLGACIVLIVALPAPLAVAAWLAMMRTARETPLLSGVEVPTGAAPRVTAITPACNEEASVEATVRGFLAQRDVAIDVVAVDDRSTDGTAAILERLAEEDERLAVRRVTELPEGWLGKVHALHVGVRDADAEWLFFADADVRLAPQTLARAIAHAETRGLDCLTAYPQIDPAGLLTDITWAFIGAMAGLGVAPHRLRDPDSDHAFSVGAFILVRRSAFASTPGFEYLQLEVADDMGVSILMKAHGFACDVVNGRGEVQLAWYTGFRDLVVRSQKNFFGIMSRFSLARGLLNVLALAWVGAMPFAFAVPTAHVWVYAVPAVGVLALGAASWLHARFAGRRSFPALFPWLGALLLSFVVLRSTLIGVRDGGIRWRGVLYESERLRPAQRYKM